MEKQVAITILEDIYNSLQGYNWKENRIENHRHIPKKLENIN